MASRLKPEKPVAPPVSDLTEDECLVLGARAGRVGDGRKDGLGLVPRLRDAIESLKEKGMLEQVWVVSQTGLDALAIAQPDRPDDEIPEID